MEIILDNQRKATDVLLSLELKIDNLIKLYQTLSFDIKILSNKVNSLIDNKTSSINITKNNIPNFSVETSENKAVSIKKEDALPITDAPLGFRRNSRPETYANATEESVTDNQDSFKDYEPINSNKNSNITVVQRVVDKNGKSLFLADVEILSAGTNEIVFKTRTNGAGKWQAQLSPGNYKTFIRKRESLTKEKIEALQTINVDGTESLINLDMLIIK